MVSEGAILGRALRQRVHTHRRAVWVITRETMDLVRKQNPEAYYRVVARVGQRLADRVGLLSDTSFGVSASPPLLAPRTERDLLGCREVPGRAYFGVQTLRAVENFAISGVALRDFSRFIDAFAFVKKAAALANAELGVLGEDKRDAIAQACDEIIAGQASRPVRRRHGPGRRGHLDQHERQRGDRQPRSGDPRARAQGQYAYLHPNDDVNCSQSTNDAYPTALKLGVFSPAVTRSRRWRELQAGAARQGRTVRACHQDGPNAAARRRADDAGPGVQLPTRRWSIRRAATSTMPRGAARRLTGCDGDRHRNQQPARLRGRW